MQGGGAGVDHGLGALPLIAAVVEDDGETFVLHCVDDAADVFGGECPAVVVGEQPRGRLGHYHAGDARRFQRLAVGQQELRALLEQGLDDVGLNVDGDHDFGHVVQAAGQGVGADAAGEDGAVGEAGGRQTVGFQELGQAPGGEGGNLQAADVVGAGDEAARDMGHLIVGEIDGGAKGFRLDGQVHDDRAGGHAVSLDDGLDGFEMCLAVGHGVDDAFASQLDAGMGHDGHRHAIRAAQYVGNPLCHV